MIFKASKQKQIKRLIDKRQRIKEKMYLLQNEDNRLRFEISAIRRNKNI